MRESGRSAVRGLVVVTLGLTLMGMGGFGGGRDTNAPAREFRATLTDADGTHVAASRVTAGGDTSLEGDVGRGRLRVPFDNVTHIAFNAAGQDRDRVTAEVRLREGEPLTLNVRSSTTFYGQTPGGAYSIRVRDLKSVDFEK